MSCLTKSERQYLNKIFDELVDELGYRSDVLTSAKFGDLLFNASCFIPETLSDIPPVAVTKAAADAGISAEAARQDHKHDVFTAAPSDVDIANAEGASTALARADHTHNLPFGPVQTALGAATGSVSFNNQKITNVLDPTSPQDVATKAYADALAQGLSLKDSCYLLALSNVTTSGNQTIDGVLTTPGKRVLLNGQTIGSENGIWVTAVGAWTRASDMAAGSSAAGAFAFIEAGTVNANSGWVCTNTAPSDVVGTDAIYFTQFSGAGMISAGAGLTKTGSTIDVIANADGSITVNADDIQVGVLATDAQHGIRGGGTQHAVATSLIAGFESAADKTKLDGIAAGAAALTAAAPVNVTKAAAAVGVATDAARADHKHDVTTAAPVDIDSANAEGVATSLARSDHTHNLPFGPVQTALGAATSAVGFNNQKLSNILNPVAAQDAATKDYVDTLTTGAVFSTRTLTAGAGLIGGGDLSADRTFNVGANADGSITVNADDIQVGILATDAQHGSRGGGLLHALAVAAGASGFMSGTDKFKLDGISSGAAALTASPPADVNGAAAAVGAATTAARADHKHSLPAAVAPADVTKFVAAAGTSTNVARADHKHDVSTAAPLNVGTANTEGTSTSLARSDHIHNLPFGPVQTALGAATSAIGFNSQKLSSVADPTSAQDAATKAYVDAQTASAVPSTRTLTAGAGLTGGGDLSTDRTFNVGANADGSIVVNADDIQVGILATDAQHGIRGGDTQHAIATPTTAGFESAADKTKLDGITAGAAALTSSAPVNVTKSAAVVGVATDAARADHKHDITTAVAGAATPGDSAAEGSSSSLARADHKHSLPAFGSGSGQFTEGNDARLSDDRTASGLRTATTIVAISSATAPSVGQVLKATSSTTATWQAEAGGGGAPLATTPPVDVDKSASLVGTGTEAARNDHKHDITTAAASTIGTANTEGAATSLARSDHGHDHGAQTVGTMHAVAIPAGANGFMSGTDKTKLDGVATGATNTPLTSTAPVNVTKAAAVVGVSTEAARADHKHDISTAVVGTISVGDAAAEGAATTLARSDHTHALTAPSAPANVDGAAAAAGTSTNVARADHKHNVNFAAPAATGVATASGAGSATTVARSDHTHQSNTAPVDIDGAAAAIGTSGEPARADHKHSLPAAVAPQTTGTANAAGTSTNVARADHVHDHGAQTIGTMHAVAIAAGANGFMSGTDKTKLDGIATGAAALTAAAPVDVDGAAAVVGVATTAAKADHKHSLPAAVAPADVDGVAAAAGTSINVARSDHKHSLPAAVAPADITKAAAAAGTSTNVARADHKHDVTTAAAVNVGTANTEGTSTSLARADHVHNTPFSAVQTALGAATSAIDFNSQKLSSVADPTAAQDAATKAYVDAFDWKPSVRVATTANITLSGTQTIDGISLSAGERVLVKNQTTGSQNGLYIVAAGAWSRTSESDANAEVTPGLVVSVEEGTVNKDSSWILSTDGAIVLGTTALTFLQYSFVGPGNLSMKAGSRLNATFSGNPKKSTVTFTTAYASTNYAIGMAENNNVGGSAHNLTVESKSTTGFVINTNTNNISNMVEIMWQTQLYGEQ